MTSFSLGFPYPPAGRGFWSPVTSTINWCEEDYYATTYAAEIVNTLTNLFFIALAIKGCINCVKNRHDSIFFITYVGFAVVGTGSFLFHATLKYPMQLIDELAMIYTTCLAAYALFTFKKSTVVSFLVGSFLTFLAVFVTLYYHYLQDPGFHQAVYAALTATVVFRSMWVMEHCLRPSLRGSDKSKSAAEQARLDQRDLETLRVMWIMIGYGLSVFLGGFLLWTLDNQYCSILRRWRHEVGLPWGIVLEGHGWWHIFTGTGAYFFIQWGIWLRHCLKQEQDTYELYWPRLVFSLPLCVRREHHLKSSPTDGAPAIKANGINGNAKKTR